MPGLFAGCILQSDLIVNAQSTNFLLVIQGLDHSPPPSSKCYFDHCMVPSLQTCVPCILGMTKGSRERVSLHPASTVNFI